MTTLTLRLPSGPEGHADGLALTLLEVRENAAAGASGVAFRWSAQLKVQRGAESRIVRLTETAAIFDHLLKLVRAGDEETQPGGPRESVATIEVTSAK